MANWILFPSTLTHTLPEPAPAPTTNATEVKPPKLERRKVLALEENPAEDQFREDVRSVLGYGLLPDQRGERALRQALRELDIRVFSRKAVAEYKVWRMRREPRAGWGSRWVQTPLSEYKGAVPEFALQTALDIKRRCPTAQVFVEELTQTKDPFLVVIAEGSNTCHYVEVWNEPDFKAKREA